MQATSAAGPSIGILSSTDPEDQVESWGMAALLSIVIIAGMILLATTSAALVDVIQVVTRVLFITLFMAVVTGLFAWRIQIRQELQLPVLRIWSRILIAALLVALTIPIFGIFKQFILPMRGFPYDAILARIERSLFLGNDPWRLSHSLLPNVGAMIFFDRLYSLWMMIMPLFPILVAAFVRTPGQRLRLIGCWVLSWLLIGGLAAWTFGSAGPCYYTALIGPSETFGQLDGVLNAARAAAHAQGETIGALDFQPMLLSAYDSGKYAPAGGISAMPSMHVAMATLFAIGGFQVRRWLGFVMSLYCLLIWVGSIHLGWHYAADGLVSAPMVILLWYGSGRVFSAALGLLGGWRGGPVPATRHGPGDSWEAA